MSDDKVYKTSEAKRARNKAYYEANKEKESARKKAYYEANKERELARNKAYYEANKEKEQARKKAYREANRDRILAHKAEYRSKNREILREKERTRWANTKDSANAKRRTKFSSDIPHKLIELAKNAYRRVTGEATTIQGATELLGCSAEEYQEYIESKFEPGMTWENHKKDGWHIDHILPLNESEVSQEEKLKRLHYTNTQPLWAKDNYSKGNNT